MYYSNLVRKLYEDNMDKFKNKIYSKKKLFLPRPEFYVLYMGKQELPEDCEMLSSHFVNPQNPCIDLRVLNINIKYDGDFIRNNNTSDTLRGYSFFVHRYQYHYDSKELSNLSLNERSHIAIDLARKDCISQGIFVDYLNRKEFLTMLEKEFTMDDYITLREEEARQEGLKKGLQSGIQALILDNLEEGFPKDKIILKLQRRFSLTKEDAEYCYNHYNK